MTSFSYSKLSMFLHFLPHKLLSWHQGLHHLGTVCHSAYPAHGCFMQAFCAGTLRPQEAAPPTHRTLCPSCCPVSLECLCPSFQNPSYTLPTFSLKSFLITLAPFLSKFSDWAVTTESWKVRTGRAMSGPFATLSQSSFQSFFSAVVLG